MSVKRGRTAIPSSSQKAPVVAAGSAKVMKIGAAAEPSRPDFMPVASPANFGEPGGVKIGEFLKRCHYCKKRIAENEEVFMYGDFCGFCSTECRDHQITRDQSAMKKP
ncbi:hypothetical protein CASFOL_010068 [Castilleja foliolosa]|uniref:FLZ-type domain-containing protein n=1 Tax=Castilleja foliolosa TaxID=1961234 RepID=A0ABD3DRH6_9LAMI